MDGFGAGEWEIMKQFDAMMWEVGTEGEHLSS